MIAIYAALPLGAIAGTFGPWVDHTTLEPFRLATYARPFFPDRRARRADRERAVLRRRGSDS